MSTRISSLHHSEGGLASAEYILAIPVFLVMLLVIMDIGKYRTAMLHTIVASRNAAWAQSEGGACLTFDDLPPLIDDASTVLPPGCSSEPDAASGSRFWQELDRAGGQQLTATVSGVEAPSSVKATARLVYDPYDWPEMTFPSPSYEFTMMSRTQYTHDEQALRVGYDREMAARFRQGTGRLMDLFPRVFPGAQ